MPSTRLSVAVGHEQFVVGSTADALWVAQGWSSWARRNSAWMSGQAEHRGGRAAYARESIGASRERRGEFQHSIVRGV